MKIDLVTITGADDKVDQKELLKLQKKYPFVEWGILFSTSKEGTSRYPLNSYIYSLSKELNLSAHFCGQWAKGILERQSFNLIDQLQPNFKRIQLNYNFKAKTDWWEFSLEPLFQYCKSTDRKIILQHNYNNLETIDVHLNHKVVPENINFLYDASGGNNKEIKNIDSPIAANSQKYYTGYAGGINLENIENICTIITRNEYCLEDTVWIDMESGVRTNNEFDLDKVTKILEIVSKFVSNG
jgi:hypothetical protein